MSMDVDLSSTVSVVRDKNFVNVPFVRSDRDSVLVVIG